MSNSATTHLPILKLYGYWRSSSAWRVRTVLHLKEIAFESVPVHLVRHGGEQYHSEFLKRNPLGQIPVLEWEENGSVHSLTQSVAICEYLNARWPTPPLFPADPLLAARCRQIVEIVNAGIQPLQNMRIRKYLEQHASAHDDTKWTQDVIATGLAALEAILPETADTFAIGNTVTNADVFIVPQLYNARRNKVELAAFPLLRQIDENCSLLPAFKKAHPDSQADANT